MKITRENLKKFFIGVLLDIAGGLLYGAGVYTFAENAGFVPAGISGIALILKMFIDLPIGLMIFLINIPITIYCFKTLGKGFLLRSVQSIIISSLILDYVIPLIPLYNGDTLIAAVFSGLLSGAGLATFYKQGSSTGGADFVILSTKKKLRHISIGAITTISDGVVIITGGLLRGGIDGVLLGLIMTLVCSIVIDKIYAGFDSGQVVIAITEKPDEVAKAIMECSGRGVTTVDAVGAYTGSPKKMILCACRRAEAVKIRTAVYRADDKVFTILCPYDTAYGLGFLQQEQE